MQPSGSGGSAMWEDLSSVSKQVYNNPKVSLLMNSRAAQYLSGHPVVALAVIFFCASAAVPVGLFVLFAVVTIIMSAIGFLFFEGFLLFVGALSLLCTLTGLAFFSVVASSVMAAFYLAISNILNFYYPHLVRMEKERGKDNEDDMIHNTTQ
ncbi:promethin isoform X2 [Hippocampus comes]|uniref:promethin isoform X2 n=1 Tax=Hippocampus comes TaxID=109280 RepID=UPI00094E8AD8|nr:PREDICTED: promethin isoform X2 [Hippocampus comes]